VIYLTTIAVSAVLFGLLIDQVYASLGLSARALVGQASEIVPFWAGFVGAIAVLLLSVKPVSTRIKAQFTPAIEKIGNVAVKEASESAPLSGSPECGPT